MAVPSDNDLLQALRATVNGFQVAVGAVRDDQWELASPCDGWSVRDVVDHVVVGDRYGARALGGATLAEAIEGLVGLGPDSACYSTEVAEAAKPLLAGFDGSLDRPVGHPVGTISARRFLGFRILDQLGHTWDVAMPTKGSAELDPFAVEVAFDIALAERATLEGSANFDLRSGIEVDPADPLNGFLLLIGRTP